MKYKTFKLYTANFFSFSNFGGNVLHVEVQKRPFQPSLLLVLWGCGEIKGQEPPAGEPAAQTAAVTAQALGQWKNATGTIQYVQYIILINFRCT